MVQINFAKREVQCKVVYYGPPMSGKTANLRQIHDRSPERVRGTLTTIATDTNRTLFFDFLPLNLGLVGNVRAKINLYAIPYIESQNAMRLLVLEGVDGVVFVADSAPSMQRANLAALENLHENLNHLGRDLREIPLVFQWNKRDLKEAVEVEEMEQLLNPGQLRSFPAAASMGAGVFQTLKAVTHAVLVNVTKMIVPSPAAEAEAEVAAEEPVAEEPVAEAPAMRISAVTPRRAAADAEPAPEYEEPPVSPIAEGSLLSDREPEPVARYDAGGSSSLRFDDVRMPPQVEQVAENPSETPSIPPWRHAAPGHKPAVQSTSSQFAEHLSTDSFSSVAAAQRQSGHGSAHATSDLPPADVPRAADIHPAARALRERRPAETETALEPAGSEPAAEGWADYTDPHSVDLQASGGWELPASGAVRVRGPAAGWDEPARNFRRVRDARPVVDRRRRPRYENVETISTATLWTGSLFALFVIVVVGYLVHALL